MITLNEFKRRFEKEIDKSVNEVIEYPDSVVYVNEGSGKRTLSRQTLMDRGFWGNPKKKLQRLRQDIIEPEYFTSLPEYTRPFQLQLKKEALREALGGVNYEDPKLANEQYKNLPRRERSKQKANYAIEKKQSKERNSKKATSKNSNYTPTKNTPTTQTVSNATNTSTNSIPKSEPKVTANTYAPSGNDVKKTTQAVGNAGNSGSKRKYTKTMMEYWNNLGKGGKVAVGLGTAAAIGGGLYGGYKLMNRDKNNTRK